MDLTEFFLLIENNFWVQQIFSYSSTILLDYTLKRLEDKSVKKDISWQLLHCLQETHRKTCIQLNWEYDGDAYIEISKKILSSNINICNETSLVNIFSTAVGHQINLNDVKCWVNNFIIELSAVNHEQLREFLKLKVLIKEDSLSDIQKRYLKKFQQIVFSNEQVSLYLYELYFANNYSFNNKGTSNHDLLDLIEAFIYGDFQKWLQRKEINFPDEVTALFIFGHQCTGKSTLVSKIVYDHYLNAVLKQKSIYIVNFADRSFRNNNLMPREICNYLSIETKDLNNSLLIIDGLDESEMSCAVASDKLEYLINDLKEYNCKLIVTSRPNFFYTVDLKNTLSIRLMPFSLEQASMWLEKYQEYETTCNINTIVQQINALSEEIKSVILIPYIFQTCITNKIQFERITELARLFDIVFSNDNAEFLSTPYNPKPRNIEKDWSKFESIITQISKYALCTTDYLIPISIVDELLEKYSMESKKVTSEFLLFRKDDSNYAFVHNSIPCFFIARHLYNTMSLNGNDKNYEALINELNYFSKNKFIIPSSVLYFIEYFARTNKQNLTLQSIEFLKLFLSNQFNNKLTFHADIVEIQKNYYLYFVNIVRLIFAFISPNVKKFESFEFFDLLNQQEQRQFILYTKLGESSLDCIRNCSFKNKKLNDINLQGINLSGKLLLNTTIQHANFMMSNLSGAYFINSDYSLCCFDDANCKNIDFTNSTLFGCSFVNTRLNGANFTNANLDNADLRGAQLNKCQFGGASVRGVKIFADQLRSIFDFDINYIRENKIEVYAGECLIPDELLEYEYQKQRPISYAFNRYKSKSNT